MSGLQGNVWVRSIKREGLESKADVIVEAMEKAKVAGAFVKMQWKTYGYCTGKESN